MRIIAGKYKKTPLFTLEGNSTRPTRDMVKEAVFSSLQDVEGMRFLDLFSGSGSIGLEALSRGAEDVIFNDTNPEAVKIIRKNLEKVKENRKVYNLDCHECLRRLDTSFDCIYLDPPYAFEEYYRCLEEIIEGYLLNEKGIIVLEVKKDAEIECPGSLEIYKEKKYGISKVLYLRRR